MTDNATNRQSGLGLKRIIKNSLGRWEGMLLILFIIINVVNSLLSENYLNLTNLASTLKIFLDTGLIAIPMMMVLLMGEIDISVGSQIALIGTVMGWASFNGAGMLVVILIGFLCGIFLGFLNGLIIARFPQLSSTIVTLATSILYRGLAWMILENRAYMEWPTEMPFLSWGNIGGIPFILFIFLFEVLVIGFIVHRTTFGRSLYAIGLNRNTSYYSGVRTKRNLIIVYAIVGLCGAVAAMFLVSKLGSARANMAKNYEMEAIAMTVLGGISVNGGSGHISGVLLSVFVIGCLRYGLGLINVSSEYIMIITGFLLIIPVALPTVKTTLQRALKRPC